MSEHLLSSVADLEKQRQLLQKEYNYEKELYHEQTQQAGIYKRIQQGVCWYPVSVGKSRYNSLNQLTVEIENRGPGDIESVFEYGRPVCFFKVGNDGTLNYLPFSATIGYVQEGKMVVHLPGAKALSELNLATDLGVQLFFDDTTYRTMFAALTEVMTAKNNRTAFLREILTGNRKAEYRQAVSVRFPWLNPSQEKAVNQVLQAKDIAVVHGPPGTGKTTTLVEAVYETLRRETQVLVCAQSNTAVDWISEKLVDRGINVLRIGNPTRVNDKMLSFTYERRFESHPDYPELWKIRKTIREMVGHLKKSDAANRNSWRDRLSSLRNRATEIEMRIEEQLFAEARVIACTLVGSASRMLEKKRFSSLFIDEAAQALEAACWIAISRADRIILAGDHCQLPPTIKSPEAAREGLGFTLLQKIVNRKPETVSLLTIQYRMHEEIMRFPSVWFYQDRLVAAPEVKYRSILDFDSPVVWVDTAGADFIEKRVAEGMGRINVPEAKILVGQLKEYILKIGIERMLEENIDIGVISPYRAQVQYLRKLIKQENFFRPLRRQISVHTVDGFQGQERDVIFISLVRANDSGQIGFLKDLRRMNVAITRARMKLVVLGNSQTLTRHPFYKAFFDYVSEKGVVIPLEM